MKWKRNKKNWTFEHQISYKCWIIFQCRAAVRNSNR
jgi:hypothetical protein